MKVHIDRRARKQLLQAPLNVGTQFWKKVEKLEEYPEKGQQIQRRLVPEKYSGVVLWRLAINDGWRVLYTINFDKLIILEILSHKEYEHLFKY